MPYQNRVDPRGQLHAVNNRGRLMGNRGRLHDDNRKIVKHHQGKRWISCSLDHKQVTRQIMGPSSYTELFFLDEATALSAGHRPYSQCRRQRLRDFREHWLLANTEHQYLRNKSISLIDEIIHPERVDPISKEGYDSPLPSLPNGTFVILEAETYMIWAGSLLKWSFSGYHEKRPITNRTIKVITPKSIVKAFSVGFIPDVCPSANILCQM